MTGRRTTLGCLLAVLVATSCQGTAAPAPRPVVAGPAPIPDAQLVVDAPLFVGQNAFAAPLAHQTDYTPELATVRADGGNSGVFDGPGPLAKAPVTGSAALAIGAPLLWGRDGLTAGCQMDVAGLTRACLATVDTATLTVGSRWSPPGQDLILAGAEMDDNGRIVIATRQRHIVVVARPDGLTGAWRVARDVDLSGHLSAGQSLLATVADASGNLWFTSGAAAAAGDGVPATGAPGDAVVGYVTSGDQVVTTTLAGQQAENGFAVDQGNVFLATVPDGTAAGTTAGTAANGQVYDLAAAGGQVTIVWQQPYDAGTTAKAGSTDRGTGAAPVLLGAQYLALADNADAQAHLLVFLRGSAGGHSAGPPSTSTSAPTSSAPTSSAPTSSATGPGSASNSSLTTSTPTSTSTTTPAATSTPAATPTSTPTGTASSTSTTQPAAGGHSARLLCRVPLFTPGASAVTSAPVGYSSGDTNSVIVANGFATPAPLASPSDDGPGNNMNQMPGGVARIDVLADGSGCQTQWTAPLRLKTAPVLATTTGLIYGYTQDDVRAATGSYIWYFAALDYPTGRVVWRQRAGAGSTKNDNGQPTILGANGVLYQTLPLGLTWMRDLAQHP